MLFIFAAIIMLASLSGLIFLVKGFSGWVESNSKYIIAFSSGIFAVVTYNLLIESAEFAESWLMAVVFLLVGFFVFSLIERIVPEIHHHEHEDECDHSKNKVIWGDALHNIGDGILLATSFAIDVKVGIIAAFGIFIHEFIQEITEFSVLKMSGMSTKKALVVNFIVSATIFIGVLIGINIIHIESITAVLFGISSGVFLHLVVTDLIPKSINNSQKDKNYFIYLMLIVAGILTILGVSGLGGHESIHGHEEDNTHIEG